MAKSESTYFSGLGKGESKLAPLIISLAGRITPVAQCAWFVQRYLHPESAANVAMYLPGKKAAAIVDRLSTQYLVNVTKWVDAVRLTPLLRQISPEAASRIAKQLADERDFAAMSGLTAYLSAEAMVACVRELHSGDDLLKVAEHIEEKHLLSPAILSLSAKQLPVLFSAADAAGKWVEIFSIVDVMDDSTRIELGQRLATLEPLDIRSFLRASLRLNTWPQLLDICLAMEPEARQTLAASIAEQDEGLHTGFLRSAKEQGKMQLLLKLVGEMPMDDQRRLVRMAGKHGIRITSVL